MTELIAIILAVGGLLPLLTSVFQQPQWSDKVRTWVGVALSLVAGLVTYVTQYGLDIDSPSKIVVVVVGVILAAAASYKTIWKPAGVAPAIEEKVLNTSKDNADYDQPVAPEPDVAALPDDEPRDQA